MRVPAPRPGTDARLLSLSCMLAVCTAALLLLQTCTTTSGQEEDEQESTENSDSGQEDESDGPGDDTGNNGLEHPAKPTAWHTRVMLRTTGLPSQERLDACREQMTALAQEAQNLQDMLTYQGQAETLVGGDPQLYHYCFYQNMSRLDDRLTKGGPLFSEVATSFFEDMRMLWLLGRALDKVLGRDRYFSYLQSRYIQISRDTFGRDVQVVGPPLGGMRPENFIHSKGKKEAGPAPAH